MVFHLVIFIMVFLAIYPVAVKSIDVENVGDMRWDMNGDIVIIEVPLVLKNYGTYDIKNLKMDFTVENESATFIEAHQSFGNINSGTRKNVVVQIPINLTHIYNLEAPNFYHFYHYDDFTIQFHTSLDYMWGMVHMSTSYVDVVRWQPIVKEFTIYHPSVLYQNDSTVKVVVPYTINTASYLYGTANFDGTVYGEDFKGSFSTEITLGERYDGELSMVFNPESAQSLLIRSQTLHLRGNLTFLHFSIPLNTDYSWGAPLNNLHVEVLNNGTVHYSFTNDADFDMNLTISKDYYYQGSLVLHEETEIYVPSKSSVDRYESTTLSEAVDEVIITFYDENTGLTYQEVIQV